MVRERASAKDDVGSKALAACLAENLGRNGVMHGSHDSSEIEAREKGVTRKRDARDAERPAETRIERQQRQDEATNFAPTSSLADARSRTIGTWRTSSRR